MATAFFPGGAYALTVRLNALGTAETVAVGVPHGGRITKVVGVSAEAGDTATAAVTVKTSADTAIAELDFTSSYTALTLVEDTSLQNTVVAAGDVLKVATDGGGAMTDAGNITIFIEV